MGMRPCRRKIGTVNPPAVEAALGKAVGTGRGVPLPQRADRSCTWPPGRTKKHGLSGRDWAIAGIPPNHQTIGKRYREIMPLTQSIAINVA
ncbi:MAG: hypothetical protein HC918_07890 [Oscillatoriales cyanobacterium SM2_1_8]|nr:hypothetical protein [Oscillatoriales cyanobacterium SM2_1_8]